MKLKMHLGGKQNDTNAKFNGDVQCYDNELDYNADTLWFSHIGK